MIIIILHWAFSTPPLIARMNAFLLILGMFMLPTASTAILFVSHTLFTRLSPLLHTIFWTCFWLLLCIVQECLSCHLSRVIFIFTLLVFCLTCISLWSVLQSASSKVLSDGSDGSKLFLHICPMMKSTWFPCSRFGDV